MTEFTGAKLRQVNASAKLTVQCKLFNYCESKRFPEYVKMESGLISLGMSTNDLYKWGKKFGN